jgi:hypothetical protein
MDEKTLRKILFHQVNFNIAVQEYIFDSLDSIADENRQKQVVDVLRRLQHENKELISTIYPDPPEDAK